MISDESVEVNLQRAHDMPVCVVNELAEVYENQDDRARFFLWHSFQ
jgi:hypothetical protein